MDKIEINFYLKGNKISRIIEIKDDNFLTYWTDFIDSVHKDLFPQIINILRKQ